MSFLSFLLGEKKKSANVAKERLQLILAHERSGRNASEPDYMADLQRDLIAVIGKYIKINSEDIKDNLERQDNLEVLEEPTHRARRSLGDAAAVRLGCLARAPHPADDHQARC